MTGVRPKKSSPLRTPGRRHFNDYSSNSSYIAWANNINSWPGASTSKRDTITQNRTVAYQQSSHTPNSIHPTSPSITLSQEKKLQRSSLGQPLTQHVNHLKFIINQLSIRDLKSKESRMRSSARSKSDEVESGKKRRLQEPKEGAPSTWPTFSGSKNRKYTSSWGPWSYWPGSWLRKRRARAGGHHGLVLKPTWDA